MLATSLQRFVRFFGVLLSYETQMRKNNYFDAKIDPILFKDVFLLVLCLVSISDQKTDTNVDRIVDLITDQIAAQIVDQIRDRMFDQIAYRI